ncbi:YciI family protein [Amycolatopsis sp. H20-H5]|uniref:YciI family protein n=1 Tax=Amycolatopsis sp. H20-H5 TaxID=3046309 RepID=UPI002DBDDAFA|nr:YciI family protein [Amycolatopsis sp. H20-H5]MEC3981474.1 YciI family protein [Amycolatopsis sp. H20-H5]
MKYLIMITMNPAAFDGLAQQERDGIMEAMGPFMEKITATGELLGSQALADPRESSVVKVRDGVPVVTDGPYTESKEYLAGYYLVEVESKERAVEIAGMVPDAHVNAMEIRPVIFSSGIDL